MFTGDARLFMWSTARAQLPRGSKNLKYWKSCKLVPRAKLQSEYALESSFPTCSSSRLSWPTCRCHQKGWSHGLPTCSTNASVVSQAGEQLLLPTSAHSSGSWNCSLSHIPGYWGFILLPCINTWKLFWRRVGELYLPPWHILSLPLGLQLIPLLPEMVGLQACLELLIAVLNR